MTTADPKPLLIVQMGTPPADVAERFGHQGQWIAQALSEDPLTLHAVQPAAGQSLPPPETLAGAVISGSWNMVTDREDWSERTAQWVREAMTVDLPLLGICYGHQLMAHALGGVVDYHPQGLELGCHPLELLEPLTDDPVLSHLEDGIYVHLTHEQTVLVPPKGAKILARSKHDPHQILRYGPHALSVQFHPEFNPALQQASIQRRAMKLLAQGVDVDGMLAEVRVCDAAHRVLRRFALGAVERCVAARHETCEEGVDRGMMVLPEAGLEPIGV